MPLLRFAFFTGLFLFPSSLLAQAVDKPKQQPDALDGPPFVTCKAWAVADGKTGLVLRGLNEAEARPMASTTKIMTAWIVFQLAAKEPKVLDEIMTMSERADKTTGSTADIRAGEKLPVRDMLFGLLLPSGNDAATALAEHFGRRFAPKDNGKPDDPLPHFVAEMNRRAAALGMKETKYLDPHGLGGNLTSARDLVQLAHTAMKDETFRKYVATRRHSCEAVGPDGTKRTAVWANTNQLLDIDGYDGVKTGTTTAAGACLVASGRRGDDQLLIVVLGATSPDARYVDARNLFRWAWTLKTKK